jgi:hypothetical protein
MTARRDVAAARGTAVQCAHTLENDIQRPRLGVAYLLTPLFAAACSFTCIEQRHQNQNSEDQSVRTQWWVNVGIPVIPCVYAPFTLFRRVAFLHTL